MTSYPDGYDETNWLPEVEAMVAALEQELAGIDDARVAAPLKAELAVRLDQLDKRKRYLSIIEEC